MTYSFRGCHSSKRSALAPCYRPGTLTALELIMMRTPDSKERQAALARALLVLAVTMILLGACRSGRPPIDADSPTLFRADAITVSPDGKRVAVACRLPNQEVWSICFWDTGTGRLREGYGYDARMAWSPVDLPLFANGREHTTTIDLWNFDEGRTIRQFSGHQYPDIFDPAPELLVLTFSPDGQQRASAFDGDSTVTLWRVSDGVPLHVLDLMAQ